MSRVAVVTPWLRHPELMPAYAAALEGADQVVVVENEGPIGHVRRDRWTVLHPGRPLGFAESNNAGAEIVREDIDVVVFLNNDIRGDASWLDAVRSDVADGALFGPSIGIQTLRGVAVPYVEGWCVAATRETWSRVGPWDAGRFPKPYWEDVELSLRAVRRGVRLCRAPWRITHLGGTSTSTTPGAWDGFDAQRQVVESMIGDLLEAPAR